MEFKTNRYHLFAIVSILMLTFVLAACGGGQKPVDKGEPAKPSVSGGPGEAINLKGDAAKGADLYAANCVSCHGEKGVGGVANPGGKETVPALAPIDDTMVSADYKTFATNIDLFIEHGSKPEGDNPTLSMVAFGDNKALTPQEIADVIAYVISLNNK